MKCLECCVQLVVQFCVQCSVCGVLFNMQWVVCSIQFEVCSEELILQYAVFYAVCLVQYIM